MIIAQFKDQKVDTAMSSRLLLDATAGVRHKHNGLRFSDEGFVVSRNVS